MYRAFRSGQVWSSISDDCVKKEANEKKYLTICIRRESDLGKNCMAAGKLQASAI